jgi:hypothetical protein
MDRSMTPAFTPPRPLGILGLAAGLGLLIGLTGAYVPGEPEPRPNILGNPSMEIDQANEGGSLSLTSGANAFVVDQWSAGFHSASATVSAQRVADAPAGFANSLKLTVATGATVAAGDYLFIRQPIEANELTNLALGTGSAQQACVSFWVKSSIGSYTLSSVLQNYAGTRSYPVNFTVASANIWTPFSACFTLDTGGTWVTSGTAGGAYLIVAAVAGSAFQGTVGTWVGSNLYGTSANTNSTLSTNGATFQLTGVKFDAAPGATPYVRRPFAEELLRSERYYRKSYDIGTATGAATHNGMVGGVDTVGASSYVLSVPFGVPLRAVPTISFWDGAGNANKASQFLNNGSGWTDNLTVATAVQTSTKGLVLGQNINNTCLEHYAADARLSP